MSFLLDGGRPVLRVPDTDVVLADGRRLRRWGPTDPRRREVMSRSMDILDIDGWNGPKRLIVIASIDEHRFGRLLHVSMSSPDRDPPWADIKAIRYAFYPSDVDVIIVLPRDELYVAGVPDPRVGMDSHTKAVPHWRQGD
ncbi:MAG TPA: hypothetical protein VF076_07220 [Acidimicrobiales bacterium]